jgi:trehalose/maltose hydrolase-like predicted phosphorylase
VSGYDKFSACDEGGVTASSIPSNSTPRRKLEAFPWMMLTYAFGGMRDYGGTLSFWPRRAPEDNAILRFPLTYRGQMIEVEIGLQTVTYELAKMTV